MALSVASGTPFHGRAVKQGTVIYIAGEGHNGLSRRCRAWGKHRSISLYAVSCYMSNCAARFLDRESAEEVTAHVRKVATDHGAPVLIVIDTLARNFGPGDENSTAEMGKFVSVTDRLRLLFPGCTVLIIHHSGHSDYHRARGAIALKGALDCEYLVEKRDDILTVVNTKMKDAPRPPALAFKLEDVIIREGIMSAALVEVDAPNRPAKLSPACKLAQDTYVVAAVDGSSGRGDNFAGLHIREWRDRFFAEHAGDNDDAKRQAFHRVRRELESKGVISREGDIYRWNDEAVNEAIIARRRSR